jgi:DNA-binding transcriptional MocR family regulator
MSTIAFTRGVPSADLLPVAAISAAAVAALELDAPGALAYAPGGYIGLREWIAERHGVSPQRVVLFNGSLEGVGMLVEHLFAAEGGSAIVEDPTYDRSLIALRRRGADVIAVPLEADGIDLDGVRAALDRAPTPKLIYVIPTFQNPAGVTLSRDKRTALVELARDRGVLVLEDDPYGLLRFEGVADPTLFELDGGENVVYSSSFTKTVAPGLRTGYLVLPERLVGPITKLATNTYIGPNAFAEATLAAYCRAGHFEPNVESATVALKTRRDAMELALRESFPAGAKWTTPAGGYFYWIELPEGFETAVVLEAAIEAGVPFVAGADFTSRAVGARSLRLAFSAVTPVEIDDGVRRLGDILARLPISA